MAGAAGARERATGIVSTRPLSDASFLAGKDAREGATGIVSTRPLSDPEFEPVPDLTPASAAEPARTRTLDGVVGTVGVLAVLLAGLMAGMALRARRARAA